MKDRDEVVGEIALSSSMRDGGPLLYLAERAKVPAEHLPVGWSISGLHVEDGNLKFHVIAVRFSEVGKTVAEIKQYAKTHDVVPVHGFYGKMPMSEVPKLLKLMSIQVRPKALDGVNLIVQDQTGG